jgi:hypothetical protein
MVHTVRWRVVRAKPSGRILRKDEKCKNIPISRHLSRNHMILSISDMIDHRLSSNYRPFLLTMVQTVRWRVVRTKPSGRSLRYDEKCEEILTTAYLSRNHMILSISDMIDHRLSSNYRPFLHTMVQTVRWRVVRAKTSRWI